jgi:hypothetical protein
MPAGAPCPARFAPRALRFARAQRALAGKPYRYVPVRFGSVSRRAGTWHVSSRNRSIRRRPASRVPYLLSRIPHPASRITNSADPRLWPLDPRSKTAIAENATANGRSDPRMLPQARIPSISHTAGPPGAVPTALFRGSPSRPRPRSAICSPPPAGYRPGGTGGAGTRTSHPQPGCPRSPRHLCTRRSPAFSALRHARVPPGRRERSEPCTSRSTDAPPGWPDHER